MSATQNDGGNAFPQVNYAKPADGYGVSIMEIRGGMSLRDWFAGQALVSLSRKDFHLFGAGGDELNAEIAAQNCYEIADAMLAERQKVTLERTDGGCTPIVPDGSPAFLRTIGEWKEEAQ